MARSCSLMVAVLTWNPIHSLTVLNASTPMLNGASVSAQGHAYARFSDWFCGEGIANCWTLYGHYNYGLQLHLSLDESWSFSSDAITNLTIEVEYIYDSAWTTDTSLTVAFSQWDVSSYFATKMVLDNSEDHLIHPKWDSSPPYTANLTDGDPTSLATEYVISAYQSSIFSRLSNDLTVYDTFYPYRSAEERNIQSSMKFTLTNYPGEYTVFSYTNPGETVRSCGFSELLPNRGMNVYFTSNEYIGSQLNPIKILSISVDLSIESVETTSTPPTSNPITASSSYSTSFPSAAPSEYISTFPTTQIPIDSRSPTMESVSTNTPTVSISTTDSHTLITMAPSIQNTVDFNPTNPTLVVASTTNLPTHSPSFIVSHPPPPHKPDLGQEHVSPSSIQSRLEIAVILVGIGLCLLYCCLLSKCSWKRLKIRLKTTQSGRQRKSTDINWKEHVKMNVNRMVLPSASPSLQPTGLPPTKRISGSSRELNVPNADSGGIHIVNVTTAGNDSDFNSDSDHSVLDLEVNQVTPFGGACPAPVHPQQQLSCSMQSFDLNEVKDPELDHEPSCKSEGVRVARIAPHQRVFSEGPNHVHKLPFGPLVDVDLIDQEESVIGNDEFIIDGDDGTIL